MVEICNECGRSVAPGSGLFVDRIPDLNTVDERREMGKPYPEGDYICRECEAGINSEASGHKPPNCPHCGKPLESVEVTNYEIWEFRPGGDYRENEVGADIDQKCPHCGGDLLDLFFEGVANYTAEA